MNIHIVEDDPVLARALQINLEIEGHSILISTTVSQALKQQETEKVHFVILDLGLPDRSGFDFLTELRSKKNSVPVIILSAQSDEDSIVRGLNLGANDFMKKPYSFKELYARLKVNANKNEQIKDFKKMTFADVVVDTENRRIEHLGGVLELNRREFDIFSYFVQRAEMIISRDSLIQILDKENEIFDRTIDSHISHIRKSMKTANLESIKISSVYGLGYRMEKS